MAYNRSKIVAYGGVGVIIAALIILALFSAPLEVVGQASIVELESVIGGNLAITIITDTPEIEVTELKLTIDSLEVKRLNDGWSEIEIPGGRVAFDLLQRQATFIDDAIGQLEPGTMIRMHIVQLWGKIDQPINQNANATLNNGEVVNVVLPNEYIEVKMPLLMSERVYIVRR